MYRIDLDLARIRVPVSPLTTGFNIPCVGYDCVPHIVLHTSVGILMVSVPVSVLVFSGTVPVLVNFGGEHRSTVLP